MDKLGIVKLLKDIDPINKSVHERIMREDVFDVMYILRKDTDERYLHSRFIASILDPRAPHHKQDIFLREFLNIIGSKFEYSINSLEISPNYYALSENKDRDIFICDRTTGKAIVLENKIFAPDSNHEDEGQLVKYYRLTLEDHFKPENIEIYYLNFRSEAPSEISVTRTREGESYPELCDKVKCIDYRSTIHPWIEKCLNLCLESEPVYDALQQYKRTINRLMGINTNKEEIYDLMSVIGDNIDSTKFLADNFIHVKWWTVYYFWDDLYKSLNRMGYYIDRDQAGKEYNVDNKHIDFFIHGTGEKVDRLFRRMTDGQSQITFESPLHGNGQLIINGEEFSEELWLNDFTRANTFALISEDRRKQTVEKIVEQALGTKKKI